MARLYLTRREYDELLEKQNFKCCVDGCEETAALIAEHSTPQVWLWAKPDQLMCIPHHKAKTRKDIKAIWKAKRLNGEAMSQHERRRKFGSKLRGREFWRPQ